MSFISKIPIQSTLKRRRIPNAFMLFVKDQKEQLVQKCPEESMTVIGTILSKKWKAMDLDEKRVYYDKYNALKRRYEDSTALNSIKEEDSMSMDKDLIKEIREINKTQGISFDRKQSNKIPDDSSDFTTLLDNRPDNTKKSRHRLKSPSKSKEGKKSQTLRNPFLIFAKEQRSSIKAGNKSHISTILGNMWQQMDSSEKKKYVEKAKRSCRELISSSVIPSDRKSKNKSKKKRGPKPKPNTQLYGNENGVSSSKDTAVIQDKSEKKENQVNMEPTVVDPQHQSTPLQPDSKPCPHGALPQYQQSVYNGFRLPQSQAEMNNVGIPYSPNIGGFYRPYFYPPDPFWMYQQAMFPHHYYPFASPYHSHCHCCTQPYHGLGASSHFRSVIYGRTSALYNPSPSAAAASPDAGNDVRDDGVSDEGSDRLVIVDDVVQPDTGEHA